VEDKKKHRGSVSISWRKESRKYTILIGKFMTLTDSITQPVLTLASGLQVALPALWLDVGARPGMQTSVCMCV